MAALVIARMAAAFLSLVLVLMLMFFGTGYGALRNIFLTVIPVAFLVFAFCPRRAYAVGIVRMGALALSLLSITVSVIKLMGELWDPPSAVGVLIVIGLLALMAHEAYTWKHEE